MTALYVRHSLKAYANGKKEDGNEELQYDPPLTEEGIALATSEFTQLIAKYPLPTVIQSSPMLRARQTARECQRVIFEAHGVVVPIHIHLSLTEYLGNIKTPILNRHFTDETVAYGIIRKETKRAFNKRVKGHLGYVSNDVVWHITHGIVIHQIAKEYGKTVRYPKELHGIMIEGDVVSVI